MFNAKIQYMKLDRTLHYILASWLGFWKLEFVGGKKKMFYSKGFDSSKVGSI